MIIKRFSQTEKERREREKRQLAKIGIVGGTASGLYGLYDLGKVLSHEDNRNIRKAQAVLKLTAAGLLVGGGIHDLRKKEDD